MPQATQTDILLSSIRPTKFLIPRDKLEEIARHYDGTIESIQPIVGYQVGDYFYPKNGNKRAYFLYAQGKASIKGYMQPHDKEDVEEVLTLTRRAEGHGVRTLADLSTKIVSREEYNQLMPEYDAEEERSTPMNIPLTRRIIAVKFNIYEARSNIEEMIKELGFSSASATSYRALIELCTMHSKGLKGIVYKIEQEGEVVSEKERNAPPRLVLELIRKKRNVPLIATYIPPVVNYRSPLEQQLIDYGANAVISYPFTKEKLYHALHNANVKGLPPNI